MEIKTAHPSVAAAIERLDRCAGILRTEKEGLDYDLYVDLVSQAILYGQHLTTFAAFGVPLTNSSVRSIHQELALFCDFIETEIVSLSC